jgi:hypothetical protein
MGTTAMADVQWIDDTAYIDRAMAAYYRAKRSPQEVYQQPSRSDSGAVEYAGKRYVVLANVNGILAVYRIKVDGFLKRLRRWPAALNQDS